jgi:hypothetical protein
VKTGPAGKKKNQAVQTDMKGWQRFHSSDQDSDILEVQEFKGDSEPPHKRPGPMVHMKTQHGRSEKLLSASTPATSKVLHMPGTRGSHL